MRKIGPAKITIVGVGHVGATTAFTLVQSGLVSELVLMDIDEARAGAEAMDLGHAASFGPPLQIIAGKEADCEGSDIVIFSAGANQAPGETRLDLVQRNAAIVRQALPPIVKRCPEAILLMVTNPVDVLTYVAWKISGLPPSRVLGSGTVLDSARFRHLLATFLRIDPRNIHAHVIGEHGDTEVPVWSTANIAGASLEDCFLLEGTSEPRRLEKEIGLLVKESAYEIIEGKGATAYGVAAALRRICEAILRNENSVLTVSSMVRGIHGLNEEICLSLPCLINRNGRERVLTLPLDATEEAALHQSSRTLRQVLDSINL